MARTGVEPHRWFPHNQPQTLEVSAALLYWNAALGILFGILGHGFDVHLTLLLSILEAIGAFGLANERRWGYVIALIGAVPALFFTLAGGFLGGGLFSFVFQLALVILLLHPQSRSYAKTWYR